jgi:hypothetical protein
MEGKALAWLVEMERKGVFTVDTEWNDFVRLINSRFGHHREATQKLKNYQNQRESLTESIKKLLERSEKGRKGEQAAKEYEDEIPEGREMDFQEPEEEQKSVEQKEIKDFQEPKILQKGRIILSEESRTIEQLEVCGEGIQEEKNGQIKNDEFLEPSPKIEAMELKKVQPILEHGDGGLDFSKEVESRKFENLSLAFKDTAIIVSHQPFDEIPQPIQVKLLESEPISPSTQPLKIQKNDLICGLSGNGSGSEEERDSMGFSDVGLRSKSAKRKKRKLGINVHLGLEYTGEHGEEEGFLNLGFEKRLAKRGIGCRIFDPGKKFFSLEVSHRSWTHPGKKSLFFKYGCWIFDSGIERGEREKGKTEYRRLQGSQKIHSDETLPGLRFHEVSTLSLYCLVEINETRTKLKSKIGIVMGGRHLVHDCWKF